MAEAAPHVLAEQNDNAARAPEVCEQTLRLRASLGPVPGAARDQIAPLERVEVQLPRDVRQALLQHLPETVAGAALRRWKELMSIC